jgi:lactate dehydrogenase-like 2-hydroxyacid dehydrogenase
MKSSAYRVNVARGDAIDDAALVDALQAVYRETPGPEDRA